MSKFLKIKVLIPILFGVLVLLGIIQGMTAVSSVNEMDDQTDRIMERLVRTQLIGDMEVSMSEVRRFYSMMFQTDDHEERVQAAAEIKRVTAIRDEVFARYEAAIVAPQVREIFTRLKAATAEYDKAGAEFVAKFPDLSIHEADELANSTLKPAGQKAAAALLELGDVNKALAKSALEQAKAVGSSAMVTTIIMVSLAVLIGVIAAVLSFLRIARPIDHITASMNALAQGDTQRSIPHVGRVDEIGEMAVAVTVFRDNALTRIRLERDADANRSSSEQERIAREELAAKDAADVQFAVDSLADGLRRLAEGDMTYRLQTPFAARIDTLRNNYNDSVEKLQGVLRSVGDNARMIDAGANEIRSATEDLSKRTEQQAASVEETAAALEQVTTAVKESVTKAGEAGDLVAKTRKGAERSGEVVRKAVIAMQEIEKSSNEISNIIGVIDDIAFQTNLLALNAGVEAARAGEAGKGFAVVAQEVRELAQRSANAAKEIKALITKSGEQVRSGVGLVGETGTELESIVTEVQEINRHVEAIVSSSREQSTGLSEISSTINQMDKGTQQNASMVEQSTAATYSLASQAAALNALLAQFRLGTETAIYAVDQRAPARPQPSPARELGKRLSGAFSSRGSAAVAVAADNWTEF